MTEYSLNHDFDTMLLEQVQDRKKYRHALAVLNALKNAGFEAMYGWDKGHGFWIRGHKKEDGGCFFYPQAISRPH